MNKNLYLISAIFSLVSIPLSVYAAISQQHDLQTAAWAFVTIGAVIFIGAKFKKKEEHYD